MLEINNRTKSKINIKLIKKTVEKFLDHYRLQNKAVSLALVGDNEIRKINKQYRRKDRATDVLSFNGENDYLGEILIDYAQIKRQAKEFGRTRDEELVFILVHGLLHLIGYNDETEKDRKKMIELGEGFINKI